MSELIKKQVLVKPEFEKIETNQNFESAISIDEERHIKSKNGDNEAKINAFKNNELEVLININILAEEVESYIADTLVGLNCHDKAIVMYKDVMGKYGEDIYILEMLAYALQLSGKYKEYLIHFERIIEILDDNTDIEKILNYLGIIFDINIYYSIQFLDLN